MCWAVFSITFLVCPPPQAAILAQAGTFPSGVEDELQVVVIANNGAPDGTMTKAELQKIFLGKSTKWSNGKTVRFVNLKSGKVHGAFTKEYTGKTASQYRNYWRKRVFTGKGRMPKTYTTERKLLEHVAKTPGAVGYVSKKTAEDPKIVNDPKTGKARVKIIRSKG